MGNATKYTKYVTKMLNCYSNQTKNCHESWNDSNHDTPFLNLGSSHNNNETCHDDNDHDHHLLLSPRRDVMSDLEHSSLLSLEGFSLTGVKTNHNNDNIMMMSDYPLGGRMNVNPSLSEENNGWIYHNHNTNNSTKDDSTKLDKVLKLLGILFCLIMSCLTMEEVGEEVVHKIHHHDNPSPNDVRVSPTSFPTVLPPTSLEPTTQMTSRTQLVMDCCIQLSASVGQSSSHIIPLDTNNPQAQALQFFLTGSGRNVTVPSKCQWDTDFGSLYALMILRASLDIPTSSWKPKMIITHIRDVCNWHRITCDRSKQTIQKLHLSHLENNNNSTRHRFIPKEIAGLRSLDRLELYSNPDLIGTIPSTIGQLSNLEYLYIHHTSLTGTIPKSLSSLSNLHELFLESTQLIGTMPKGICQLKEHGTFHSLHADCAGPSPKVQCPTPVCCDHCYKS